MESATSVRPSQLRALLAQTIRAKLPVLVVGEPGIGKTDILHAACDEAQADCVVMHPAVSDPTDFKGLPWATDGGATFLPYNELSQLINADKLTACFMDDLGQATPAVQAAAMQLILARRVNGHKVSPHVVFLAATNDRKHRAGVSGILEPVKSRFATIVHLAAHVDDWCTWASSAGIAPELIAFIRFRPALLSDFKPTSDMTNSPSPRTWHSVSKLLALNLPRELQVPSFEGAVGRDAAVEFTAFLRVWQSMVSPDVILTSPDTAPIPDEPSAMYAVATAIAIRVQAQSMPRYVRYLDRLIKAGKAEFAALSMKTATARADSASLTATSGYVQAMSGPMGQLLIGG